MVLHHVGTQLAEASDKAAFGRNFTHCVAHAGLYEADLPLLMSSNCSAGVGFHFR
jgi:hypothetical protein